MYLFLHKVLHEQETYVQRRKSNTVLLTDHTSSDFAACMSLKLEKMALKSPGKVLDFFG